MSKSNGNFARYRELLYPYRWQVVALFTFSLISAGVVVIQPWLYHYAIDDIALRAGLTMAQRMMKLTWLTVALAGCIVLAAGVTYSQSQVSAELNAVVTAKLRYRLLRHMLKLPLNTLTTMKTGGAAALLNKDTSALSQIVSRGVIVPGVSCIQIVVAVVMAFTLNWRLSFAALIVILTTGILARRSSQRLRPQFQEIAHLDNELSSRSTEMFGGVRLTRIYGREATARRSYARLYHLVISKTLSVRRQQASIDSFTGLSFAIIQAVIIGLGVFLTIKGKGTLGDIFAIVLYSNRIINPINDLIHTFHQLQEDLVSMDRVYDVLDLPADRMSLPEAIQAPAEVVSIKLDHVGFTYPTGNVRAVQDLCVEIPGGKTTALVGRSGAGKTTLMDLLCRFYEPSEGTIYINDRDTQEIELASYRRLLGMVQQDVFLFDGTVRDNISYAVQGVDEQKICDAARRANAHEFIMALPQGYDTVIGERGVRLSGGQRQRISMAQAFLADPKVLVLDEATSNLDTENEQVIQEAMKDLLRDRTTLIVAHRLSTIMHADMIIVLDAGRIVETGSHQELIARRGLYCNMIEQQYGTVQNVLLPLMVMA